MLVASAASWAWLGELAPPAGVLLSLLAAMRPCTACASGDRVLSAAASVSGVAFFLCIMVAVRAQTPPRQVAAWLCAAGAIVQAAMYVAAPKLCLPCLGVALCFLLGAKMLPRLPVSVSRPRRSRALPAFAGVALACSVALQAASSPYWPVPTGGRPIAEYRGKEASKLVGMLPEGRPGSWCW